MHVVYVSGIHTKNSPPHESWPTMFIIVDFWYSTVAGTLVSSNNGSVPATVVNSGTLDLRFDYTVVEHNVPVPAGATPLLSWECGEIYSL